MDVPEAFREVCGYRPPLRLGVAYHTSMSAVRKGVRIASSRVVSIASTSAAVSWTTDESATSKLYYASGNSIDLLTALTTSNSSYVTSHLLSVTGLTASTTYQYVISSADNAGNTATSSAYSFIMSD